MTTRAPIPGGDRDGGYGWISIALHWLTALAIIVLLFIGDSISSGDGWLDLHTMLASFAWAVLAGRIVWRLMQGHPPAPKGPSWSFTLGAWVHYILLAAIAVMLVSGPAAALTTGHAVHLFGVVVGSPGAHPYLHEIARTAHAWGAAVLVFGSLAHVAGVLKHMFVDRDNLLDRIMAPPRRAGAAPLEAREGR